MIIGLSHAINFLKVVITRNQEEIVASTVEKGLDYHVVLANSWGFKAHFC